MSLRVKVILILLFVTVAAVVVSNCACSRNGGSEYNGIVELEPAYPPYLRAISAQEGHGLAIMDDSTVWAWGSNADGQLGFIGEGVATPRKVAGIDDASAVFGWRDFSGVVRTDGTVWVWGGNWEGRLATTLPEPTRLETLENVRYIWVNSRHFAVLHRDSRAYIRGVEGYLERLDINVVDIAAGPTFMLILADNGEVWGIGDNSTGQLGSGIGASVGTPVRLAIDNVKAVAAGATSAYAVTNDGFVYMWGQVMEFEDRPDGEAVRFERIETPTRLGYIDDVVAIASGNRFAVAIQSNGSIWGWGMNEFGVLGDYALNSNLPNPRRLDGFRDVVKISASGAHFLALRSDGTLWEMGQKFGVPLTGQENVPIRVMNHVMVDEEEENDEEI
ncbi:MAG: hypothetical protein FWE04_03060 [Oscillospiraceae bacterium]|nr:hypothetical protein [Oscillospiraceae bacterium]